MYKIIQQGHIEKKNSLINSTLFEKQDLMFRLKN